MQQESKIWIIAPRSPDGEMRPYGNVADISNWLDWERYQRFLPIRLFVGVFDSSWQESITLLNQWQDFIWSDDSFPWVTKTAAERIKASGLTGFEFQETLLVEVNKFWIQDELPAELPILYRLRVLAENDPAEEEPEKDFFVTPANGERVAINARALDWLQSNGWTNFYMEPLA